MKKTYDLLIIGGGPGGYVGAIRAAQLGMKVGLVEKASVGGTCLNIGCIPTKAMFQSAEVAKEAQDAGRYGVNASVSGIDYSKVISRKDDVVNQLVGGVKLLLRKNKVDVIKADVSFCGAHTVKDKETGDVFEGQNVLICTGSINAVPPIPGTDGKNVIDSTELMRLEKLPESIAIVGGGVIGCEFANILNAFGSKVTVIEMLPHLLGNMEESCAAFIEKQFLAEGINVLTETKVCSIEDKDTARKVVCEKDGDTVEVEAEYVLISTGRKAQTAGLDAEQFGLKMDHGFVCVDDHMRTSVKGVYAAGDVTGVTALAHAASEGAVIAVENMNGADRTADFANVPKVVFVDPEISSCGLTEAEAKEAGYDVVCGMFNLAGNGKSIAMGKQTGFVKVVSEKKNHEILGMHMVGHGASELVTLFAQLLTLESVLEDVENTIYPHPAVSESIREACLDALGRAVHK